MTKTIPMCAFLIFMVLFCCTENHQPSDANRRWHWVTDKWKLPLKDFTSWWLYCRRESSVAHMSYLVQVWYFGQRFFSSTFSFYLFLFISVLLNVPTKFCSSRIFYNDLCKIRLFVCKIVKIKAQNTPEFFLLPVDGSTKAQKTFTVGAKGVLM